MDLWSDYSTLPLSSLLMQRVDEESFCSDDAEAHLGWHGLGVKVEKFIEDIRGCHLFCVDLQGSVEGFDTLSWKSDKVPMSNLWECKTFRG